MSHPSVCIDHLLVRCGKWGCDNNAPNEQLASQYTINNISYSGFYDSSVRNNGYTHSRCPNETANTYTDCKTHTNSTSNGGSTANYQTHATHYNRTF